MNPMFRFNNGGSNDLDFWTNTFIPLPWPAAREQLTQVFPGTIDRPRQSAAILLVVAIVAGNYEMVEMI
jgi:hypothetical protein